MDTGRRYRIASGAGRILAQASGGSAVTSVARAPGSARTSWSFAPTGDGAFTIADAAFADLRTTGLVLLYPLVSGRLRAPLFRRPPGRVLWLFALLRTAPPGSPETAARMVAANRAAHDLARAAGAVAYPVNALPLSAADWREHHGTGWRSFADAKRRHDPHLVLGRGHGLRL
ncbi:hypothetical protein ABZ923_39660 [Streptomyces sp. NPDC046881]|uniref:hypothetical protein n=1 Tax=Streptomyces sp. NPDC046881 TaxID=3155374 RepID=UPI0033E91CD9